MPDTARQRLCRLIDARPVTAGSLLCAVLYCVGNPLLLHRRGYIWGDAADSWLLAFRWYGASGRAGIFGDFFPFAFSGFSHGWDLEYGLYNPAYHLLALAFPDSVLSVKLCVFLTIIALFALSADVARGLGLSNIAMWYVGFASAASGFVLSHAQHLSYLASAVAMLAVLAAVVAAKQGHAKKSFWLAAVGVLHGGTAGYPPILIFGAQVLLGICIWNLRRGAWRGLAARWLVTGSVLGIALSLPALIHSWVGVSLTSRGGGLTVEQVMHPAGSLPLGSVVDLLWPWRRDPQGGVDPSMDRFHALFVTGLLVVTGCALLCRP